MVKRQISEQRKKEIEKIKTEKRNALSGVELSDVLTDSSQKTSRDYAKEFKTIYVSVRKGLVMLSQKRVLGMIENEDAVNQAKELLQTFLD